MSTRRRGREVALQILYQTDLNPDAARVDHRPFLRARLRLPSLVGFAEGLVEGVTEHRGRIDKLLDERSEHWRISRMAATDRAVLRLAVYELAVSETPGPVIVDEAIELARRYGGGGSPSFVGGILGRCFNDRSELRQAFEPTAVVDPAG